MGCSCSSSCRIFCSKVSCFPLSATCHGSHRDAEAALKKLEFLDEKEPLDDAGVISEDDGSAISLPCDGWLENSGTEGESEANASNGKSLTTRVTKVMIRCAFLEVHVEEEMFAEFGHEDDIKDVEDESFEQEGPLGEGLAQWFTLAPFAYKRRWRNFHVLGPCLQSSISTLSFSFLALFFSMQLATVSMSTLTPTLSPSVFSLQRTGLFRTCGELWRTRGELWLYSLRCSGDLTCGHFRGRRGEAEKPKNQRSLSLGPVDRLPYRSQPVILNGHCGVILQSIFKPNISLERSCLDLNAKIVFVNRTRNGRTAAVRSLPTHRFRDWRKTDAALQQSYRLSKVPDKRTALEELTWRKNETKYSVNVLFIFQFGKDKENAKLLTCCLKKT